MSHGAQIIPYRTSVDRIAALEAQIDALKEARGAELMEATDQVFAKWGARIDPVVERLRRLQRFEPEPELSADEYDDLLSALQRLRYLAENKRRGIYLRSTLRDLVFARARVRAIAEQGKVDRARLEVCAAARRDERLGQLAKSRRDQERRLEASEAALRRGVVKHGPRRGQPYTEQGRKRLSSHVSRSRRAIARIDEEVAVLTTRDAIRAWTIDHVRYRVAWLAGESS